MRRFVPLLVGALLVARAASAKNEEETWGAPSATEANDFDVPKWSIAAAAGTDFGFGLAIPTLHSPAYAFNLRLGAAIRTPANIVFVVAGQSGVNMAFNAGSLESRYGYLVRIPLDLVIEGIYSDLVDHSARSYVNFHVGALIGGDFLLAATCNVGSCAYIQPSSTFGLGGRLGVSFSTRQRSGFGVFMTLHNNIAQSTNETRGVATLIWSFGWTSF